MAAPNFIQNYTYGSLKEGTFTYQSPSNIALVKYWGKYEVQMPENPSISFTLSNCHTTTTLRFKEKEGSHFEFKVFLDGERELPFEPKIKSFFERVEAYIPFLRKYSFRIETSNSFPHSSGIASSASGMSALALCLMEMDRSLSEVPMTEAYFIQKASFLARLGSGSASRSIEGPLVVWGEHLEVQNANPYFGVLYPHSVHENFKNYQDTILLVDKGEKQVSSSVGHNLMHGHPYARNRFKEAHSNLSKLITVFETGNLTEFIHIVESEALQLHAMMMTSQPYFILMKPNTLEIIQRIWSFRKETKSKLCFTLDAGANVHVLYPEMEKDTVLAFIQKELAPFCKNGEFIQDEVGMGAKKVSK